MQRAGKAFRWVQSTRAGVMMAYALMAPVLIAGTGIAVDIGYWYQQQTSMQSAADAAALSVAQGSVAHVVVDTTTNSAYVASTGAAPNIAVTAANGATNSKYGFATSGSANVTVSGTYTFTAANSTGSATYTATVTAPRRDYFSRVSASLLGLTGRSAGTQGASATVKVSEALQVTNGNNNALCTANCPGVVTNHNISSTGGANITCTNCGVYGGGTLSVSGSGVIMGATVSTAQTTVTEPQYSAYIGVTTNAGTPVGGSSGNGVTYSAAAPPDYLASMNPSNILLWNPGWTSPSAPTGSTTFTTPNFGYNTWNQSGVGDCVNASGYFNSYVAQNTNYVAYCELYAGYLKGMTGIGVNGLLLNEGTTNGTTYITGGFTGQSNSITQLNGNNYYIDSGMTWASSTSFTISGGSNAVNCGSSGTTALTSTLCFTVVTSTPPTSGNATNNGGVSLTNGTATFGAGDYFLTGTSTTRKGVTTLSNYGLVTNSPTVTINGGNWFVTGGVDLSGGTTSSSLASGLYEFLAYTGSSNGAFYAEQGYTAFGNYTTMPSSSSQGVCPADSSTNTTGVIAPATYFFDGGFNINSGTKNVLLCSGIYYIRNGNLTISSGTNVTGTNVTFILQGTASYTFNGGATLNISAPTTVTDPNCVSPSAYPESAYQNPVMPYDGTNGHGICGVVIYQDRNDTATDYVSEGAASTFNGAIYTPNAPLILSGAGALNITATGMSGLTADSISDSGSGKVTVTVNAAPSGGGGSGGSGGSTTSILFATFMLVG
jgi:Flp pilus assembly protein TadG